MWNSGSLDRRSFIKAGMAAAGGGVALAGGPWAWASAAEGLEFASALEAARAIRSGQVSSEELTRHILGRIERYDGSINAVVTRTPERALRRARAADAALARGEIWGRFHGVPGTVKDTYCVAGVRTTAGAPSLADYVPDEDAAVVERLESAGIVVLGKTNVPIMASDWQSYNEIFGTTNNPWDLTRTPGGSTGGGAAALAAGLSFLSIGSDIAGSIRIPAHFCGVYGHKPTLGVVPQRGHIPPPPGEFPHPEFDLPVAGPLARSATDLKAAMQALGGPDRDRAIAYSWALPPARGCRLRDYRIGYVFDHSLCPVVDEVREVLESAVEALVRAGIRVEQGWPERVDAERQWRDYLHLLYAFLPHGDLTDEQLAEVRDLAAAGGDDMMSMIARGWMAPYSEYFRALSGRMAARAIWQRYFTTRDAFLLPVSFSPAFRHDHHPNQLERRIDTGSGKRPYNDNLFWISFATMTGLPATVAPVGRTPDGLPVGVQILGPYLEDATPIDVAAGMADVVGGFEPPPGVR